MQQRSYSIYLAMTHSQSRTRLYTQRGRIRWAAWYNTWLLVTWAPKGVVFSSRSHTKSPANNMQVWSGHKIGVIAVAVLGTMLFATSLSYCWSSQTASTTQVCLYVWNKVQYIVQPVVTQQQDTDCCPFQVRPGHFARYCPDQSRNHSTAV